MRRTAVLAASVLSLSLTALAPAAAEEIGFVAAAVGDAEIAPGGSDTFQAARRDGGVAIGDRLRTGLDSSLKIVLVDDTLLQIDEDTELTVETFHVGAAATQQPSILRQLRGRLRATVGDAFGGSTKLQVHTPTAAVGVKGTDFEVVKGQFWEACLISGAIDVTNQFGTASPQPGFCVYAYGDKAPGDPFPNPRTPLEVGNGSDDFNEPGGGDDVAGGDPTNNPVDPNDPTRPDDPFGDDDDEFEDFDPVILLEPEIEPEPDPDPPGSVIP